MHLVCFCMRSSTLAPKLPEFQARARGLATCHRQWHLVRIILSMMGCGAVCMDVAVRQCMPRSGPGHRLPFAGTSLQHRDLGFCQTRRPQRSATPLQPVAPISNARARAQVYSDDAIERVTELVRFQLQANVLALHDARLAAAYRPGLHAQQGAQAGAPAPRAPAGSAGR